MKKILGLWIIVLCCIFISNLNIWDAYCSPYLNQRDYNECTKEENRLKNAKYRYDRAESAKNRNDYVDVVYSLEQMKKYTTKENITSINDLILYYSNLLWDIYLDKNNFSEAIKYYNKALAIHEDPITLYNISIAYYGIDNYDAALTYLNKAKQKSLDPELDEEIVEFIELVKLTKEFSIAKKNRKTNDKYGFLQYYFPKINIFDARDRLPNKRNKVVIAIIDDWVNLNHPDLKNKIRTNPKEIDGDGIDNDKNGYIDDYNWWDFTLNLKPTLPSDSHGTMVAGIIAANTDNWIWIAWIVPDVEIMPLKVFWFDSSGAKEEYILEAINYAIDNWADIINLSLGGSQFVYTNAYDAVFKKANDKWIIVVVAAWNWDILSMYNEWVNTSVNKVSPVCNESNKKVVIWVWALTKNWTQAKWSNYGSCVDFYMYWEEIYSTAITLDKEPYMRADWTSFSAPIVAWIIWLWYNKFWKLKPDVVYDNLKKSQNWNVIDAAKYLDNLSLSQWELWKAITWMIRQWFTKAKNADEFKWDKWITRAEASKFFVTFANMFNKNTIVNSIQTCDFVDIDNAPADLRLDITTACRYGLLAWSKWKFMPNSKITNAQAVTVFMRMYGWKKDESWNHFADRYFLEAYKLGLIDWTVMWNQKNYEKSATRWDIAVLLYRWARLIRSQQTRK